MHPLQQLNDLPSDQLTRLLDSLAVEELGYDRFSEKDNFHCTVRKHQHSGSATGSLAFMQLESKSGRKRTQLICFGCGFKTHYVKCESGGNYKNTVVDYLLQTGPEGASEKFWTSGRVTTVIQSLNSPEPFKLGWHEWKIENGHNASGGTSNLSLAKKTPSYKSSICDLQKEYQKIFIDEWPRHPKKSHAVLLFSKNRVFKPEIVEKLINEKLLSLKLSDNDPTDVVFATAFQGLYSHKELLPVRMIRIRSLKDKTPISIKPTSSPAIGNFSAPHVDIQTSPKICFCEGEPDAIALRHYLPESTIIVIAGQNNYSFIPALMANLNLKGREVIFFKDRDIDNKTHQFKGFLDAELNTYNTAVKLKASKVHLWICPPGANGKNKDVNDYLKEYGNSGRISASSRLIYPCSTGLTQECATLAGIELTK